VRGGVRGGRDDEQIAIAHKCSAVVAAAPIGLRGAPATFGGNNTSCFCAYQEGTRNMMGTHGKDIQDRRDRNTRPPRLRGVGYALWFSESTA